MKPKPVSRIKVGPTHYEVVRRPSPITGGEGTNVAFALAAMIAEMYSPTESSKAGFRAGPCRIYNDGQAPTDGGEKIDDAIAVEESPRS